MVQVVACFAVWWKIFSATKRHDVVLWIKMRRVKFDTAARRNTLCAETTLRWIRVWRNDAAVCGSLLPKVHENMVFITSPCGTRRTVRVATREWRNYVVKSKRLCVNATWRLYPTLTESWADWYNAKRQKMFRYCIERGIWAQCINDSSPPRCWRRSFIAVSVANLWE